MGQNIELTAGDDHRLVAYLSNPGGTPRGGIVVIQEIFGVTRHIRAVADQYAAAGFSAIAPALFDRVERGVDVPYTDVAKGVAYMQKMKSETVMLDVQAALNRFTAAGKLGIVGYCWGGTMAYLAAARLKSRLRSPTTAAASTTCIAEKPRCPSCFISARRTRTFPWRPWRKSKPQCPKAFSMRTVRTTALIAPTAPVTTPPSAKLAFERSVEFFHRHVG